MIELKNISKSYVMGSQTVQALGGVSLKIEAGEFVAIMGPSGSGKSTLMHILGFLDRPDKGTYFFDGMDIGQLKDDQLAVLRNHITGFVFQQFHLLPRLTAAENVSLPLMYSGKHQIIQRALSKIKEVGMEHRAGHKPNELSGGERQRLAIARSLVTAPLILLADEPTGNLDSKTETKIMMVLKNLNAQGKTIVMVTHEMKVAKFARRIVVMSDGKIISDDRTTPDTARVKKKVDLDLTMSRAKLGGHIQQALKAIFSHKARSLLSMLGILIGIAAVITMMALGQGAKELMAQRMASLGTNLLLVRSGSKGGSPDDFLMTYFTMEDAQAMRHLPGVMSVSENIYGTGQAVFKDRHWHTQVRGEGSDYASMHAAIPVQGRFFTDIESQGLQKKAVLGRRVAGKIFGSINPIGKNIKINRINFQVIGVLPTKGMNNNVDQDDVIIIPVKTALFRLMGNQLLQSIDVQVGDSARMDQVHDAIKSLIIKRHHLTADGDNGFMIGNMAQIERVMTETTQTMNLFLGSIAAISLLVGGIGIMNIMLVSVTERTREIGLRKAVGARKSDICLQFLIEAVLMSFSGGIIGIITGIGAAALLSMTAGWPVRITLASIIMVTVFSAMIGIIFGLKPALQASQLDPVEALRYE